MNQAMTMDQYQVVIRNLECYGFNGVSPEERQIGHRLRIDLQFDVSGTCPSSDNLDETLDYGRAVLETTSFVQANPQKTLERLASLLADHLLDCFPCASAVEIELAKRNPPICAIVESAGVVLKKTR